MRWYGIGIDGFGDRHERVQPRGVELLDRLGPREEIALRMVHAERAQDSQLIQVFHALGDHVALECPREIHVVAELPKSPTGKVLKRVLSEKLQSAP